MGHSARAWTGRSTAATPTTSWPPRVRGRPVQRGRCAAVARGQGWDLRSLRSASALASLAYRDAVRSESGSSRSSQACRTSGRAAEMNQSQWPGWSQSRIVRPSALSQRSALRVGQPQWASPAGVGARGGPRCQGPVRWPVPGRTGAGPGRPGPGGGEVVQGLGVDLGRTVLGCQVPGHDHRWPISGIQRDHPGADALILGRRCPATTRPTAPIQRSRPGSRSIHQQQSPRDCPRRTAPHGH